MRCNICDRPLNEPRYNSDLKAYEPCEPCMIVIHDTLAGFTDRPAVQDDELGRDPTLEAYTLLTADDFSPD